MRPNRFRPTRTIAVCATALLTTAACATGSVNGGGGSQAAGPSGSPVKGGTLNMLGAGDIDYMDPNVS